MFQNDLRAEVTVHAADARGRAVSESARDLVQARRRFLMQRCFQGATNLFRATFRRRFPDVHARTGTGGDIRVVVPRTKRIKAGEALHLKPDPRQTHFFGEDGKAVRA